MASPCEVVLAIDDEAEAARLAAIAIAEVQRIETKYSRYRSDSIVSRINAAAGQAPVACDDETWSLLEFADKLHQGSQGLFDITSGILRQAWNFKQPRVPCVPRVPSTAELAPLLRRIGWARVERSAENRSVRLPEPGMEIDFGGFGKEYAADRAGALLQQHGARHGYVNLAGDMRFIGPRPDGEPWLIGIQDPRRPGGMIATLPVFRGGLATSGDYERFFEIDGRRYCHILDPRSGMPVTHWRTVSVLAPLAVVAGNCCTIAMLMQADGLAFLEDCGFNHLAVDSGGKVQLKDAKPT